MPHRAVITAQDRLFLQRCVELAREALDAGDEPFGSVLVDAQGVERLADRNRVAGGDHTRHPEFEIARWSAQHLTPAERTSATVYTSGEHCPMCAAAHAWVGLGRIVYASSSAQLTEWHRSWGLPPGPVTPLPIHAIAPQIPVAGPDAILSQQVRELQARHHGVEQVSTGDRLHVSGGWGEAHYHVARAARNDLPDLIALLTDDPVGASREGAALSTYETALDAVSRDRAHYLAVVRDAQDHVVATMQLSIVPGLSRGGATRLQIEGVRVSASHRGRGLGHAMLGWAHAYGRAHDATLAQLTTDLSRDRARAFYLSLGYEETHAGLKYTL